MEQDAAPQAAVANNNNNGVAFIFGNQLPPPGPSAAGPKPSAAGPPPPPEAGPPPPPEAGPPVFQAIPQHLLRRVPRYSFPGLALEGVPCDDNQGGANAHYHMNAQDFTFPSCTLTQPKQGDPKPDLVQIDGQDKHNIIFTRHPNLNMIVFEILIKLFDFAHDHIKSINRIAIVDADDFMRFVGAKQIELNEQSSQRRPFKGISSASGVSASGETLGYVSAKKSKIEGEHVGGGASSPSDTSVIVSSENNDNPHLKSPPDFLKNEKKDAAPNAVPVSREVAEPVSREVAEPVSRQVVTPVTKINMLKKDTLMFTNQMKEDLSFVLTQLISFTTPELISEVKELGQTKTTEPGTTDPQSTDTQPIENVTHNNNVTLLCCFMIVINELFTSSTGGSSDDYLLNAGSNNVDDWLQLDDNELNEGNLQIKLVKLSIIQTLMQIFDSDPDVGQEDFIKNNSILQLFTIENFDTFFDMYLRNFFTNYKKQNVAQTIMMGGAINQNILEKLNRVLQAYAANRQQMTRFLNDQIFRVFTCNLLWSLDIIEKDPVQTLDRFKYTDFGNAIMNQDCNATNYYLPYVANQADIVNTLALVPNNGSPSHPTLVILRYQLEKLFPVWNEQLNQFRQYKHIEHVLDSTMYRYAMSIDRFRFDLPPGILNSNIACCPSSFIVSNAATTLNVGVPIQDAKVIQGYTVNGREQCTMQTYAGILDPAGSMKIKFKEPYEYGNMDSNVVGNGFNGDIDRRVQFNGIIQFVKPGAAQAAQAAQNCMLSNISRNMINLEIHDPPENKHPQMNVGCNVNILYAGCGTYPDNNNNNDNNIQRTYDNITETAMPDEDIEYGPITPTLNEVRRNMLFTLVNDIVTMEIIDSNKRGYAARSGSQPNIDNLFINYYDRTIAREDARRSGDHIDRLLSTTLNKTVGDLMQVLTVLTKYGGITELHAIHSKVFPYNQSGDALREIAHHDLTASIITYFMLIFGGHRWRVNPPQAGGARFTKGPRKKTVKNQLKIARLTAMDDLDEDAVGSEDEDDIAETGAVAANAVAANAVAANAVADLVAANNYYDGIDDKYWITIYYNNPGKNQGGYMSDHNLVRLGVGNSDEINNVIGEMNGRLTQCGRFGYFTSISRNPGGAGGPGDGIARARASDGAGAGAGAGAVEVNKMDDVLGGGGRKTLRRRNKVPRFTIREKKHYARKSRKFYRKKHKTRSLIGA